MSLSFLAFAILLGVYLFRVHGLKHRLARKSHLLQQLEQENAGLHGRLARRSQRLDVLLDAIGEAVLRIDRSGRVLAANAQANRVFHADRLLELPQSMLVFYRDPEWQRAFSLALHALPEAAALPNIHVGGRVLAVRLAPLGDSQALLLCVDMTHQAELERQRQTFLANLMHDLKTPLTSLLGYARSIQSLGEDPKLRAEAARIIGDEAKRVNQLLDVLLTLDQIEHGGTAVNASCRLPQVWQQVRDALMPQWQGRHMQLIVEVPDELPPLAIGGEELRRLLMNVVENAIRHTPEGTHVEVSARLQGEACQVEVRDNGPGIPAQQLARVTERFYRADKARSRKQGGHGLGLAIVDELLKRCGGSLTLAPAEPHGLSVIMRIPLAREAVHQAV